jgi:hypothetical protein
MTRRTRTVAQALGAAIVVALLSACGTSMAGNAAVVGTTAVSEAQVNDIFTELRDQLATDPAQKGQPLDEGYTVVTITNRLTRSILLAEAARRQGVVVTQTQVDTLVNDALKTQFSGNRAALDSALARGQNAVPASEIDALVRDVLLASALGKSLVPNGTTDQQNAAARAAVQKVAAEWGVEISPRYGSWDPKTNSIVVAPDDLSVIPVVPPAGK